MAKKGQLYSDKERGFIKKRGQELLGQGKKAPWRRLARELKKELGTTRTPDAVRAEFYRGVEREKIGSGADSTVERFRRSFERMLKGISQRLQENAKLRKEKGELSAKLKELQEETKPMRSIYDSMLKAQKRAEGRMVVHSSDPVPSD